MKNTPEFFNQNELFDYMIDSHVNGQIAQCKDLFSDLATVKREAFFEYAESIPTIVTGREETPGEKALAFYRRIEKTIPARNTAWRGH